MEKIAVNTRTQAQWDEVSRVHKLEWEPFACWKNFAQETCINFQEKRYSDFATYEARGWNALTFEQWQARYNPQPDFSLERYQKEVVEQGTHVVQQRCGRPVRQDLFTNIKDSDYPIAGVYTTCSGNEEVEQWTTEGRISLSPGDSFYDLIIVPKPPQPVAKWLVVWNSSGTDKDVVPTTSVYDTLEEVEKQASRKWWLYEPREITQQP